MATRQLPTARDRKEDKQADDAARRVQWVQIELFLHNFLYYLEQIRAASGVLDNDCIFNNGHIQEGRP